LKTNTVTIFPVPLLTGKVVHISGLMNVPVKLV